MCRYRYDYVFIRTPMTCLSYYTLPLCLHYAWKGLAEDAFGTHLINMHKYWATKGWIHIKRGETSYSLLVMRAFDDHQRTQIAYCRWLTFQSQNGDITYDSNSGHKLLISMAYTVAFKECMWSLHGSVRFSYPYSRKQSTCGWAFRMIASWLSSLSSFSGAWQSN